MYTPVIITIYFISAFATIFVVVSGPSKLPRSLILIRLAGVASYPLGFLGLCIPLLLASFARRAPWEMDSPEQSWETVLYSLYAIAGFTFFLFATGVGTFLLRHVKLATSTDKSLDSNPSTNADKRETNANRN